MHKKLEEAKPVKWQDIFERVQTGLLPHESNKFLHVFLLYIFISIFFNKTFTGILYL